VLLDVRGLSCPGPVRPLLDDVSLTVSAGEVVGIYGLMGAGRTELMECLMGTRAATAGEVRVRGELESRATVQSRLGAGLALVPEDRQRDGLVQTMSVKENITLATLSSLVRGLFLRRGAERSTADEKVADLSIKVPSLGAVVTSLSGGNQQKVVLARAMLTEPIVLLLDEPTRGVDVGAKSQIASIMADLAAQGYGVLFSTSELAEALAMADRVLVMAKGHITAEYSAEEVTEEKLVTASASDRVLENLA
jgi:erythritol transport system ATP-binding protein